MSFDILGRMRSAIKPEAPVRNIKKFLRTGVAHGPIRAIVDGSDDVWHENVGRVDNLVGTQLSSGGPFK